MIRTGAGVLAFLFSSHAVMAQFSQQGPKLVGSGAAGSYLQGCSVAVSVDGSTAIVGGYTDNGGVGAAWVFTRSGGVWAQQGAKLVGTAAVGAANQGYSVSIAADGNTAIVGGYNDDGGVGAAWVFTRSGGVWAQQGAKLVGTGATGPALQGRSVSLSADGNTAIVGGDDDDMGVGAAWVFTRSGGVWTQQGTKLVGTALWWASQGGSVSLSADGNTAIVGGADEGTTGAAWVFTRSGDAWTQEAKLVGTGAMGDAFQGASVSLSADGNTAIVGGDNDNWGVGAVWVFTRSGGVWTQEGTKLVGTGAVGLVSQGASVSLSADGNTAAVGGPDDNGGVGATWVYTRTGGIWTQEGTKLVGTGALGEASQGRSVALSGDGSTAIVGGDHDSGYAGATWVLTRSGSVWTQEGTKLVGTGAVAAASQGRSVSLSADGNTAIVGGETDYNGGVGAAWVFTRGGGVWTQQGAKLVGTGAVGNAYQGASVSLSADGDTAIVGGSGDNANTGAAWVFTRSSGVWTQQGAKLVGTGAVGSAYQGSSVSLSADGNTAIVGGPLDNGGTGAAWVFTRSSGVWTQQGAKLVGMGSVNAAFQGAAVSLSADGKTLIVAGYGDNWGVGAAWVFTIVGGVWTQQGAKLVGTGSTGAKQGRSTSVSADGSTAVVGGPDDNGGAGAMWVYTRTGGVWTQQGSKLVGTGGVGLVYLGESVSLSADGNTAIAGGHWDNGQAGAAWVFKRSGGVWTQQGAKLVGGGAVDPAQQGYSVALSGDGNTAIAGGYRDNRNAGAAWVFATPLVPVSLTRFEAD